MSTKNGLKILSAVFFVLKVNLVLSQNFEPVFEDAQGKTSIITPKGFFGLNTANSTIRFQYFYTKSASPDANDANKIGKWNRFYVGANISGSANDGLSSLFSGGNFTPGVSGDLFLGHRSIFFSPIDRNDRSSLIPKSQHYTIFNKKFTIQDFLTLRSGVKSERYKLYDPSRPFNDQLTNEKFQGYNIQGIYTLLINGRSSIGISYGAFKENNIGSLTQVKFKQQTVIIDSASRTTRTIEQDVSAYRGKLTSSINKIFGVDLVRNLVSDQGAVYSINLYGRIIKPDADAFYKAGAGFYVFPPGKGGKASPVLGGIFIESGDLTNVYSDTPDFLKRIEIGLTLKYLLPSLGQ